MLKEYLGRLSEPYKGEFQPLSLQEIEIRNFLEASICYLAGTLGERNVWKKTVLDLSANYIIKELKSKGLEVSEQAYAIKNNSFRNIIAQKKGLSKPDEIILIGAHYDSIRGTPGADDNASGIAGMLAIADLTKNLYFDRTIEFVAFVNEEPPFFFTKKMGSWQYAKWSKEQNRNILAMFSLESIGYYSDKKNTQSYPFPLQFFYPKVGNFIGFVGNISSKELLNNSLAIFRKNCNFPSQGIAAPWFIPGIFWSDQLNFWRQGYKAVMITDTATFRNPNYHTKADLPNFLNYDYMARVVIGLTEVMMHLGNACSIGSE